MGTKPKFGDSIGKPRYPVQLARVMIGSLVSLTVAVGAGRDGAAGRRCLPPGRTGREVAHRPTMREFLRGAVAPDIPLLIFESAQPSQQGVESSVEIPRFADRRNLIQLTMFHEVADEPGEHTPEELYERYEAKLVAAIESLGIDGVAAESDVDETTLQALQRGEAPELTLEEGAAILAALESAPDGETIATLARDDLLMGMTTAVLDVEAVESGLEGELEAREIQSKIEGRFPMTLREFALLHQFVESKK